MPKDIRKAEFNGDLEKSYTTYRIGKAVEKTINFTIHGGN